MPALRRLMWNGANVPSPVVFQMVSDFAKHDAYVTLTGDTILAKTDFGIIEARIVATWMTPETARAREHPEPEQ